MIITLEYSVCRLADIKNTLALAVARCILEGTAEKPDADVTLVLAVRTARAESARRIDRAVEFTALYREGKITRRDFTVKERSPVVRFIPAMLLWFSSADVPVFLKVAPSMMMLISAEMVAVGAEPVARLLPPKI